MKLIVGLGNPGEKYKNTRHNAGFLALDYLLLNDGYIEAKPKHEFKSEAFTWQKNGHKIIFLKPQTFMNDSGEALKVICNFYKLDFLSDLLIIHDDSDLPLGTIRLAESSSSAGHNGVQSIIDKLGTQGFQRLRIGIESRASRDVIPTEVFVLQDFSSEETDVLKEKVFPKIEEEVKKFLGLENTNLGQTNKKTA